MNTPTKYALLQIPGILILGAVVLQLRQWGWIGTATASLVMGLWILKDILLYPLYRRALDQRAIPSGPEALIGMQGVSRTALDDVGMIVVRGEQWRARPADGRPVPPGCRVCVTDHQGMVLSVMPVDGREPVPEGGGRGDPEAAGSPPELRTQCAGSMRYNPASPASFST